MNGFDNIYNHYYFKIDAWDNVTATDALIGKSSTISAQSWAVLLAGSVPSIHEFIDIIECYIQQITAAFRVDGGIIVEYFGPKFWSKFSHTSSHVTKTGRENFLELLLREGSHTTTEWGMRSQTDLLQVLLTCFES